MKATKNKQRTNISPVKEDKFITKILENLEKVNVEEWENYTNVKDFYPCNLFSGKYYKGFNVVALFLDTVSNGFKSSRYATFNNIINVGGKIKKGAKGCVIEFFSYVYKNPGSGKNYSLNQVKSLTLEQQDQIIKIPCLKNYTVFNAEYIENLSELNLNVNLDPPEELNFMELQGCEAFIDRIIGKGNLNIKFDKSAIAFYSLIRDIIVMPERELFLSSSKYYSVLFHEIIHWTGHPERLNRELKGYDNKDSYSFEELIAEMGVSSVWNLKRIY